MAAFQFVLHIVAIEDFLLTSSSQSKSTSVLITLSTSEELHSPVTTGCPDLSGRVSYSSHISSTAPSKAELVCRNNQAKNSLNRFQIGCKVYRQVSMAFAFESTSRQRTCSTENWTACVLRAPHRLSPSGRFFLRRTLGEHLSIRVRSYHDQLHGPIRFPQHLLSVRDHGRQRVGGRSTLSTLPLALLYIEPSPCGRVRPAGDPVDSDPGTVFEDDPHPRSDAGRTLVAR